MKIVQYKKYGNPDVLKLVDVKKPIPRDNEVLIKIHATTVTAADCLMRRADTIFSRLVLGFARPKEKYQVMGLELSGIVEDIGTNVTRFRKGDEVYGFTGFTVGAYAEYKCISEDASIAIKPARLDYKASASIVDGSTTALFFLKEKGGIKQGDEVLIIGASGSIGTAAVQIAKYYGAIVTGICSGKNLELVSSLGADEVIDYTKTDYTKLTKKYDLIFDTVGKSSYPRMNRLLRTEGKYLVTVGNMIKVMFYNTWTKYFSKKKHINAMSVEKKKALVTIRDMIEAGALSPVIDKIYSLEEIPEAHSYVEKGHKVGNVVVDIVSS